MHNLHCRLHWSICSTCFNPSIEMGHLTASVHHTLYGILALYKLQHGDSLWLEVVIHKILHCSIIYFLWLPFPEKNTLEVLTQPNLFYSLRSTFLWEWIKSSQSNFSGERIEGRVYGQTGIDLGVNWRSLLLKTFRRYSYLHAPVSSKIA